MAGVTETHFCRCISRLTGIDLLTQSASVANFGDRCSTLSTRSLLERLYFFSSPGATTHRCRVIHPGVFARIRIDLIALQLENGCASTRADKRNVLSRQWRGVDEGFLPFDGSIVVSHHFLGTASFSPLVSVANQTPKCMMKNPGKDPVGVGPIAVVAHPSFEDEVHGVDHIPADQ